MIDKKRVLTSLFLGALLGIACIIGVGNRLGSYVGNWVFLLGMWYNRVIMGLLIGLSGDITILKGRTSNSLLRGAFLGFFVSLAISLASNFRDGPALYAGIAYGVIIDYFASRRK